MHVELYTTQTCPYCFAAKNLLTEKGVAYSEQDVSYDPAMRERLLKRTGRQTVPQIFFGDQHIGGFTDLEHYFKNQS